ncbi:hypothetical protein AAIH12_36105, partial [Pseudomonas aeruginosa]
REIYCNTTIFRETCANWNMLFHRLSVFPLSVPPLRERGDDVILLAGYFCEQCRLRLGLSRVVLSAGARNLLQHYNFPGNVRELEHAIPPPERV